MRCLGHLLAAFLVSVLWVNSPADHVSLAEEPDSGGEKYTLQYKFQPGEVLRWKVTHRAKIKTTVSGTTQTAETVSQSVKIWRVKDVSAEGTATFDHVVENVDMRQKGSGGHEVRYNSQTDDEPPPGFQQIAQSIGVPISTITMNPRGEIVTRKNMQVPAASSQDGGQMTIPLPDKPVAESESWSVPHDIQLPLTGGLVKQIKALQQFTLAAVHDGIATIEVATQILTPIHDPAIEAQLIQRASAGTVRFDIEAGRVVSQQMDVDKVVVGFQTEASSLHYLSRFSEEFLGEETKTASREKSAK